MPKLSVTTTARQEVGLEPRVRAQVRTDLMAYLDNLAAIRALEAKQDDIKSRIQQRFADADQLEALTDGTDFDGVKVKLVVGESKRLDKAKLMKKFGLSQTDLDACSKTTHNRPYVRITPKGEKSEDA